MLKKSNLVEKRNMLNEIRCTNMSLQELRFFAVYLSRINARKSQETRRVVFKLSEFLSIMEIKKVNVKDIRVSASSLFRKEINIPNTDGGFRLIHLFSECELRKNVDDDMWYFYIDADDKALPLMFDFKDKYFTYEIWNVLRLSSVNQLRMYEILKQYEKVKERTVSLDELKEYLNIGKNEYPRFNNFKQWVLDVCQKALKENTDICYEYELIKKAKGKVTDIKFMINKNKDYVGQVTLEELISDTKNDSLEVQFDNIESDESVDDENGWVSRLNFFSEALNNEFFIEEMEVLYKLALPLVSRKQHLYGFDASMYDYLSLKLAELNTKKNVKFRFNYLKKLIQIDIEDVV